MTATALGIALLQAYGQPLNVVEQIKMYEPTGAAADSSRILITAPFCDNDPNAPARGVYNVVSGTPVLYAPLPPAAPGLSSEYGPCREDYLAISPGLGGFPSGAVYVAVENGTANIIVYHIVSGSPVAFATLPGESTLPATGPHPAITFDTAGTFGYNMVVTDSSNHAYVVNSSGAIVQTINLSIPTAAGRVEIESPRIAPITFGKYGGYLWLAGESNEYLYAVSPTDFSTTQLPTNFGTASPEGLTFSAAEVCTVPVAVSGSTQQVSYVLNQQATGNYGPPPPQPPQGAVFLYSGLAPNVGLVNTEFGGNVNQINPVDGSVGQTVASPGPQDEGTAVVTCPLTQGGCRLTQGGYKNHFNSLVLNFPPGGLLLGNVFYTNAQLNAILQNNAVQGNGLISLAHQLITAELNAYYGATPAQNVALAIVNANTLIGNLVIPPIGSGHLSPSATSSYESTLDSFNSAGPDCPGPFANVH